MANSNTVTVMDAIQNRRAIRDYHNKSIDREMIYAVIDAAIKAPTAMHKEPWSFLVIESKDIMDRVSETARTLIREAAEKNPDSNQIKFDLDLLSQPDFNIFYNAQTLIVIYSKSPGAFVVPDCWVAAENLMLAAHALGLGTCPIALALSPLNSAEWKAELNISDEMTAIAPIIIGWPKDIPQGPDRKPPEILFRT